VWWDLGSEISFNNNDEYLLINNPFLLLTPTRQVEIWDHDKIGKDDPIGKVVIKMMDVLPSAEGKTGWFPLRAMEGAEVQKGALGDIRLHLVCPYVLDTRTLTCRVNSFKPSKGVLAGKQMDVFAVVEGEQTFKTKSEWAKGLVLSF
jgi:hypothetical protein